MWLTLKPTVEWPGSILKVSVSARAEVDAASARAATSASADRADLIFTWSPPGKGIGCGRLRSGHASRRRARSATEGREAGEDRPGRGLCAGSGGDGGFLAAGVEEGGETVDLGLERCEPGSGLAHPILSRDQLEGGGGPGDADGRNLARGAFQAMRRPPQGLAIRSLHRLPYLGEPLRRL